MNSPENSPYQNTSSSTSIPKPLILFARLPELRVILALLILTLLSMARFLPSLSSFNTQFIGGVEGDNGLYVWLFRHHIHHLFTSPWFETNGFYPYQGTLAWSDNFIFPGLVGISLVSLGLSEPAAYNFILLSAYTLSGFYFWLCIARISGSTTAALISAVAWLSWSYWGMQVGHPQLLFHLFLPIGLYIFLCALRNPSLLNGFSAALLIIVALATTAYYAVFLALMWGVLALGLLITKPVTFLSQGTIKLFLGAMSIVPLAVPFVYPYLKTIEIFGSRNLYEAHYFSANALSWVSAPVNSVVFSSTSGWGSGESYLFPGITCTLLAMYASLRLARSSGLKICLATIASLFITVCGLSIYSQNAIMPYPWRVGVAIACWAIIFTCIILGRTLKASEKRRGFGVITHRSIIFTLLFLTIFFWTLSFGPLGNPEKGQLALGPWTLIHEMVPGASAIRAVSRCSIVAMLGLCALAGLGAGLKLPNSPRLIMLLPFLILGIWVEGATLIQPAQRLNPEPQVLTALDPNKKSFLIVLPYSGPIDDKGGLASWSDFASRQTTALNWIVGKQIAAINGYSGQQSKLMRELPRLLLKFPDSRSLSVLCSFPELTHVLTTAEITRPSPLPSALSVLSVDSAGSTLYGLNCDSVPFSKRELVLTPDTDYILCATDSEKSISLAESSKSEWNFTRLSGAIEITRRNPGSALYLSRIALEASEPSTLSKCNVKKRTSRILKLVNG